ncbi:MAG: hypothetical protein D6791_09100 [Chloroflexi bacterium]|nr:MAG: hypothetical protein D6791_09100 [Chloroflexota bacterium]
MLLLLLPPALLLAGWWRLPQAQIGNPCDSRSRIVPDESNAVAFSRAFRSAILDNPGGPFKLRTTDIELTSFVALNTQGRQLADPQIHFLNDTVCLSGDLVGLGLLRPRFKIEAHPYVAAGNIQLEIRYIVVNGRVLPGWLRNLAQRITNESIQDAALPLRVDVVQVRDGEILVEGERLSSIGE